ncbi:MAG: HEAT repeat domain-containing protein [Gemmatimonadota bacterium]
MRVTTLIFALGAVALPVLVTGGSTQQESTGMQVETHDALRQLPPTSWLPDDPADSLYRNARDVLRRGDFARAATLFRQVHEKYPRSGYAAQSYYWEAFSLYRAGSTGNLRQAREVLKAQRVRFPDAADETDPRTLATRICGELAKQGDEECARVISEETRTITGTDTNAGSNRTSTTVTTASCGDEDMKIAALNAVLQMDEERAVPLLRRVLARRDNCSVALRRKAIFLVSQKQTSETEDILLAAARNDPDEEVREQAVFWLSQVGTERAVTALDSILRTSTNVELQKKALFALSQVDNGRAAQALRTYAERTDASDEVREQAIFWLGQSNSPENAQYLQALYGKLNNEELKKKVIFSISQMSNAESSRWIMSVAMDDKEPIELRKQALFWAGQDGGSITDLVNLYGRMSNPDMKEQLIFVYSQRNEKAAIDKLVDIARNDANPEMKKKALFWLSQSNDPRVVDILQQIIDQ